MLRHPQFKPQFVAHVVPGDGLFLLSESFQTVLQGRLFELVAPHLDGRSMEDLCVALRGQLAPAEVFYTVSQLEKKGFVGERQDAFPSGVAAFWAMQNIEPAEAKGQLAAATVKVTGLGGVDAAPFVAMLESLSVRTADDGDLHVVLTDHYLRRELVEFNQSALKDGRPWLLVKPDGCQVWVGPLFRPGITGCWECLATRLHANMPIIGYLDMRDDPVGVPATDRTRTPATQAAAFSLAAVAVASWIAQGELPHLDGKIQSLDVPTGQTTTHHLMRLASCSSCGEDASGRPPKPFLMESRKKVFTADGGHRAHRPEETIKKYSHLVSPICGAVSLMERSRPDMEGVMHVFSSGRNIARGAMNWGSLKGDLRSGSCGKGTTEEQARASALCEGLERYSGFFHGDEPRRMARMSELGADAIHPNVCMRYSDAQYARRDELNQRDSFYNYIPAPFDPDVAVDWTPVWSLTHKTHRYLPTAFCYFSYPQDPEQDTCVGCSNGNAAGNTLEEAVLQGFFELAERDAVAMWWYNRLPMPEVDIDSFDEPYCPQLRQFLKRHNRNLWVLDLTNDLGIPVFVALSRRTDTPSEQIMFGFGAHSDPRVALLRAVTELNQMLIHILDAPPENPGVSLSDVETVQWLKTATVANQPWVLPRAGSAKTAASFMYPRTDDLREDVFDCQRRVEAKGLEMLVLDQTRPEIGLPTVKVIVPGMRHFWSRFAPGRLYDVPVSLGWLDRPLTEAQLNPVSMFL